MADKTADQVGEDEPFDIGPKKHGMYKIMVFAPGNFTVRDVKIAVELKHNVPASECTLLSDGQPVLDHELLKDFVCNSSWLVCIHTPGKKTHSAPPTPGTEVEENGEEAAEDDNLTLSFFFSNGVGESNVKSLPVHTEQTLDEVLTKVVAPAFNVPDARRLGIFVESCLLPRQATVADVCDVLQAAPVVPVVLDLITTRTRDQKMPANAFQTDCERCQNTGVKAKIRPVCSLCKMAFVMDVTPPILELRNAPTELPWSSIESLTGKCCNSACEGHDVRCC